MNRRQKLKVAERLWGSDAGPFEGNDVRITGGVRKRCVLCGSLTTLRLSHAIPKWAYRWHKESWGGFVKTHLLSRGVAFIKQDGNKHYLLCETCEQRAGKAEMYAQAIVDRHRGRLRAYGTYYIFKDRYWRLRLDMITQFIAITALRVHYSPSVPLSTTRIPLNVRNRLRRLIFGKKSLNDPIVAGWRFVPPQSNPKHDPRQDIYEMYEEGSLGRTYILQAGGLEWALFFDPSHLGDKGDIGFRGHGLEQIICLPYSEHRRFKYPEKWLPQLQEKMNREQRDGKSPA